MKFGSNCRRFLSAYIHKSIPLGATCVKGVSCPQKIKNSPIFRTVSLDLFLGSIATAIVCGNNRAAQEHVCGRRVHYAPPGRSRSAARLISTGLLTDVARRLAVGDPPVLHLGLRAHPADAGGAVLGPIRPEAGYRSLPGASRIVFSAALTKNSSF